MTRPDPSLTQLLFPVPPARPAGLVARTVGLRRVRDRGRLQGVDVHVSAGELVVVLGGAGAGKSTLIQCLAGLDPHGDGAVEVAPRRAVVLQRASLIGWKRVIANVAYGNRRAEGRGIAVHALEQVGAVSHATRWPSELDRETTSRVLLARAIAGDPALLLLDEPFADLDPSAASRLAVIVRELVDDLAVAVVLATDSVSEALAVADRIVVLDDGQVTLELTLDVAARAGDLDAQRAELRRALSSPSPVGVGRAS